MHKAPTHPLLSLQGKGRDITKTIIKAQNEPATMILFHAAKLHPSPGNISVFCNSQHNTIHRPDIKNRLSLAFQRSNCPVSSDSQPENTHCTVLPKFQSLKRSHCLRSKKHKLTRHIRPEKGTNSIWGVSLDTEMACLRSFLTLGHFCGNTIPPAFPRRNGAEYKQGHKMFCDWLSSYLPREPSTSSSPGCGY